MKRVDISLVKGEDWSETYQLLSEPVPIQGSTNASPIVVTTQKAHGLLAGDKVRISGHSNLGANGNWTIASATTLTITLTGSTGTSVGGNDGNVYPTIDASGATVTSTWKDSASGGTVIVTPTFGWEDQTICRFTLSLTDVQTAALTEPQLFYSIWFEDSAGANTRYLTGTVSIETP